MSKQIQLCQRYFYLTFLVVFIAGILIFSACNEPVESPTIVVTEVVVVEGEQQVVTRIITQTVTVTPVPVVNMPASEPVVLDISFVSETRPDIDPQKTDDEDGIDLIENLFVGLTNYNHVTNQIEPELAYEWEVEDNGRVWTFYLRDDIFWIRPTEQDENGFWQVEPVRPVEAADFVFAIQRICNRETSTPNAFILFLIDGCEQVFQLETATPADLEEIGVQALNETTLQVTLTKPASYFLTITSLWFFHPLPPELIAEYEDDWQEPDTLETTSSFMTSGPYFPVTSEFRVLQRNPLWPITYRGNVDVIEIRYLNTDRTAWQLWEAKTLDLVDATNLESDIYLERIDTHARFVTNQTLFYLAFNFDSGVFREPEVRRAFRAAIDREALVEEIYGRQAWSMRHATPPGIIAAPPIDQVGIGYNPDLADQQLSESGFRSCRLIPEITFLVNSSDLSLLQAELIAKMWIDELGCTEEQIIIEQVQFGTLLANTRREAGRARPDIWELGWASYYPDAHNWMGDLLHCQDSENRQNRPCSEVDDLIRQAAQTIDASERQAIYREIENRFFNDMGIAPIVPLYVRGDYVLAQTWLDFTPAVFGGEQYDTYTVDIERKRLELSR